jgi:Fic family protein
METWQLALLPPSVELDTKSVLRKLTAAHRALAELKGIASTIPNEVILINTLALQEAKDSSAVENIITTSDELFKSELNVEGLQTPAAKEVQNYAAALKHGFGLVGNNHLLTNNHLLEIQSVLQADQAGFRRLPGTTLKNAQTGEVIYTPPQHPDEILRLMDNLEQYINDDEFSLDDPLIKMAVIHFQFESIHPFYDGNGRTGRIINILYLVQKDLLHLPVLYLSRYIIRHKPAYYKGLQDVRDKGDWENWILYMLTAVEQTARETIVLIREIKELMQNYKFRIRDNYKFYSQDWLNNLFKHPYTKIEFVQQDLNVSRITAANYLNQLAADGLLQKKKLGTTNYYINQPLYDLFMKEQ